MFMSSLSVVDAERMRVSSKCGCLVRPEDVDSTGEYGAAASDAELSVCRTSFGSGGDLPRSASIVSAAISCSGPVSLCGVCCKRGELAASCSDDVTFDGDLARRGKCMSVCGVCAAQVCGLRCRLWSCVSCLQWFHITQTCSRGPSVRSTSHIFRGPQRNFELRFSRLFKTF